MPVKRIVADLATTDVAEVQAFYMELFDLDCVMDQGWIVTLSTGESGPVQLSIAEHGGSGTPVPTLSIEVEFADLETIYQRAKLRGDVIAYELTDEPWGVRRFFVTDPAGHLVNVLAHQT